MRYLQSVIMIATSRESKWCVCSLIELEGIRIDSRAVPRPTSTAWGTCIPAECWQ